MGKAKPKSKHRTRKPELSAREVRFCQLLVETGNRTQSYIASGLPASSENYANLASYRLIRNDTIREYIRYLQNVAAEAAKVTTEEIAANVANIAKADRRKFFKNGVMLPPEQWPDDVAATLDSMEIDEIFEPVPGGKGKKRLKGYTRKVKTGSRLAAWRTLAEFKRMIGSDAGADDGKKTTPLVVDGDAKSSDL